MSKLENSKEIFKNALKGNYAVGAFNFVNMEVLQCILTSAENTKSPVILQASMGAINYAGIKELVNLTTTMCENLTIPVCLNLDHGKTFEDCKLAIDNGFTNVMIDASSLPYEENVKLTKKVVEYAHKNNVTVEAELGVLSGIEEDIIAEKNIYTNPMQAYNFVKETNIDSLAIAIGTSHGAFKFKDEAKLAIDVLEEIEKLLPTTPLVLHGASSIPQYLIDLANKNGANLSNAKGVPEEILNKVCKHNICKINVDSDLRLGFVCGIREFLTENPTNIDIRAINKNGMKYVIELVTNKMQNVFNSAQKN